MSTAPAPRVGIDVGGTKCQGVAIDAAGSVVAELRRPTPNDAEQLVEVLAEIADSLGATDVFGVAVPGLVNRAGVLLKAPNITKVAMLPLRDLLEARSGRRVVIDNDNTVACLAEWVLGAGRGVDDMVLVGLGTGIGGGFVSGGRLQRGHHGFAGEFGHMIVDPNGIECLCGQRGCWERYGSGSGLGHLAREAAVAGRFPAAVAVAGSVDAIRGEHVTEAALAGDSGALGVVHTYADWVALGLVNLTNLFDPGRIVLSGGLSAHPGLFLPPIQASFARTLFAGTSRPLPEIAFAQMGPLAGGIGAALLVDA